MSSYWGVIGRAERNEGPSHVSSLVVEVSLSTLSPLTFNGYREVSVRVANLGR